MDTLKVGVIGVGFIGELHARIYNETPAAELIAVADVDEERGRDLGETLECAYYKDYQELLADDGIDAVDICVPDRFHVEPAVAAAEAGKHFLIEKPVARTSADAERIREAAEQNNVRMMVGHLLRFDPRYAKVHDEVADGKLGEILHIRAKRHNCKLVAEFIKGRTSMLFYVGIHDVDIAQWIAGSRISRVYAQNVRKVNAALDCDDCIFVLFNLENGGIGTLEFSWSLPANFPCGLYSAVEAVGSEGAGYVDILNQGVRLYKDNYELPDTLHWPETNGRIMGDLKDEVEHFVDAVLSGKEFVVPTEDAIDAVRVIEGIFESMETGQPVDVVR